MTNIDITNLSKSELKAIQDQLKAAAADRKAERMRWQIKVDAMLKSKDDDGNYAHSTADIWQMLWDERLVDVSPDTEDQKERDRILKRIQARKQKLEKDGEDVGYATSPRSIIGGSWNFDRVMDWLRKAELTEDQKIELGEFVEE